MDSSNFSSAVPVRILLVDDYEPFRRYVRSLLMKRAEWIVLSEVSDGLEAVQKAEELQPDLILLDIGLPTLRVESRRPGEFASFLLVPEYYS